MKIKQRPEDFQVEELTSVEPSSGPFALYRLTKQSIGTPEVISSVVDEWKIPRRRISYGGKKDRHALTSQLVTIHHGPKKPFAHKTYELEYLGQTSQPFRPRDIQGNRFAIVLRDMRSDEVERVQSGVEHVRQSGLPNYFDDQRFGSLGRSGEWVAKAWLLGDWERALWLALADPHAEDRSSEKKQKQALRDLWGRWQECKAALERSHRRSIVTFLADKEAAGKPIDYRGAFGRISADLRGLYLSAFQSAVWNRMLDRLLRSEAPLESRIPFDLKSGPACFVDSELDAAIRGIELPLPSGRQKLGEGRIRALIDSVVAEEGLELRQFRVRYPRDSFFSKAWRRAIVLPAELDAETGDDELGNRRQARQAVTLRFILPPGSYATMLVKRLTVESLP